jgi:DNA repair protein RecN (Recombination protein N)
LIERFYLKNHLSFKEVDLEFDENLIIFTGPSGAGKSILMESLLTLFGLKDCDAKVLEATIPSQLNLSDYGIENDEPNIFKYTKEKSARYFINNQQISKKNLKQISTNFINYLTLREFSEFENENLLTLLDTIATKKDENHDKTLQHFKEAYLAFQETKIALESIQEQEKKIGELKEFALYEIQKIESINPSVDEYETLLLQKKELSKKEKLETALSEAMELFRYESKVSDVLRMLESPTDAFDDAMNELKVTLEGASERLSALDDLNIEEMLDRLEKLSDLKNKYGSLEESLQHLQKRKEELASYENIAFEKSSLEKKLSNLQAKVEELALKLSKGREEALKTLSSRVTHYLTLLHLEALDFHMEKESMHSLGIDNITLTLKGTKLEKVSSGELNRIRLATLAASSEFIQNQQGILILDEIDANLSGKESMSIAVVLEKLAQSYQIFAISHQPQLSSRAHMHFLVYKEDGESHVRLLKKQERIQELSRMISGDKITQEAIQFATSLLS